MNKFFVLFAALFCAFSVPTFASDVINNEEKEEEVAENLDQAEQTAENLAEENNAEEN